MDTSKRYDEHLRYIAAALASWRYREELSLGEMAEATGIEKGRIAEALVAQDWAPQLGDIARIEEAVGGDLFAVIPGQDDSSWTTAQKTMPL
jgi:hypothetical protein